jgi:hypothetical protein
MAQAAAGRGKGEAESTMARRGRHGTSSLRTESVGLLDPDHIHDLADHEAAHQVGAVFEDQGERLSLGESACLSIGISTVGSVWRT